MADMTSVSLLTSIRKDIVIDEEVFDRAARNFEELIDKIKALETNVNEMMIRLTEGYNTPAGKKLINACNAYIIGPIVMQEIVIRQVCDNLKLAKNGYQSVFDEYRRLESFMSE